MMKKVAEHYDLLIEENNDPVNDPIELKEYMDKWDGNTFIELLDLNESKDVLEIGVGTGRIALKVISKCKSFTGIDISSKTIERAKNHLGENVNLIEGDFLEYDFSGKYDLIYSSLTFIHFKDKHNVLEKIHSILKDEGKVIISINKSQDNVIDYGTRKIDIYPITKYGFINLAYLAKFKLVELKEVELAYLFVLKKVLQQ